MPLVARCFDKKAMKRMQIEWNHIATAFASRVVLSCIPMRHLHVTWLVVRMNTAATVTNLCFVYKTAATHKYD